MLFHPGNSGLKKRNKEILCAFFCLTPYAPDNVPNRIVIDAFETLLDILVIIDDFFPVIIIRIDAMIMFGNHFSIDIIAEFGKVPLRIQHVFLTLFVGPFSGEQHLLSGFDGVFQLSGAAVLFILF